MSRNKKWNEWCWWTLTSINKKVSAEGKKLLKNLLVKLQWKQISFECRMTKKLSIWRQNEDRQDCK